MENQQAPVMSVKDWLITTLICASPLVGLIMLFVWGFGSEGNPNRANWAKASLIWMVIVFVLVILFWALAALFISRGLEELDSRESLKETQTPNLLLQSNGYVDHLDPGGCACIQVFTIRFTSARLLRSHFHLTTHTIVLLVINFSLFYGNE